VTGGSADPNQKLAGLYRDATCSVLIRDLANSLRCLEVRAGRTSSPRRLRIAVRLGAGYGAEVRSVDGIGDMRAVMTVGPDPGLGADYHRDPTVWLRRVPVVAASSQLA
jgi:hypothetical protein